MAIKLNLGNTETSTKTPTNYDDRPKAQIWLNIGYESQDAEGNDMFISLPMGLPLDTMEAKSVNGKDLGWKQMQQAKNALLEQLQKAAMQINPGEEHTIPGLTIQVRRVAQTEAPDASENPHMNALANLGFAKAG